MKCECNADEGNASEQVVRSINVIRIFGDIVCDEIKPPSSELQRTQFHGDNIFTAGALLNLVDATDIVCSEHPAETEKYREAMVILRAHITKLAALLEVIYLRDTADKFEQNKLEMLQICVDLLSLSV